MPIHFRCRHCGKVHAAEESQVGSSITCPACQGSMTVPSSRDVPTDTAPPAGDAWWTQAPSPPTAAAGDWWVAPAQPTPEHTASVLPPFIAPPLEKSEPAAGLPFDVPPMPGHSPAPVKANPEGESRQARLLVAGGAMAALLLLAGALAILALPGKPEKKPVPPVAALAPAEPEPKEPPRKPEPPKPPKKTEQPRPATIHGPPRPADPPKKPADPPNKPADPPKPIERPKVVPPAAVKLPAASAKFVVKRRREHTEDELRRKIEKVPEVGLDRTIQRRESTAVAAEGMRAAKARKPGEVMARVLALRPDLAGLPFRMGEECHLGPDQAGNLEGGSVALRNHLGEAAGITSAASAFAAAADTRPDPKVLYGRLMAAGDRHNKWLKPEAIPALQQLLMAENESIRAVLVDQLAHIEGKAASIALAQRALYDLNFDVRKSALEALAKRPPAEYRPELLKGFDYPWNVVADHAAEALVALKMHDAVPALISLLDRPDPSEPYTKPKKPGLYTRELVRVNHLRNCLMCHAVSTATTDKVRGFVPPSNRPLPPTFTRQYYQSQTGIFVRADVTYLRQDFSVPLNVKNHGVWPGAQRFDFMVRERPATVADVKKKPKPGVPTERQKAIFFALRELTGTDAGPSPEDWKRLFLHRGKVTRRHQGMTGAAGVAVDAKGRIFVADAAAGALLRSRDDGTFTALVKDSGFRGLALDPKGRLVAADGKAGRLVALNPETGKAEVLVDRASAKHTLNPTQVAVDRYGGVYFTDAAPTAADRGSVCYVSARGVLTRLAAVDVWRPRGVALAPDGKTLYVTGAGSLALTAYPLEGAGLPGKGRVLCQLAAPRGVTAAGGAGMAVDRAGNVYVALPGCNAVQVVNPDGARLALLTLPGAPVACALGGEGGKVLHVTTRTALYTMTVGSGAGVAAR